MMSVDGTQKQAVAIMLSEKRASKHKPEYRGSKVKLSSLRGK